MSKNDEILDDNQGGQDQTNGSTGAEKTDKKLIGAAAEVKIKKELYEKNKELEEKDRELEELRKELEFAKQAGPRKSAVPDDDTINQLKAQVELLSKQVVAGEGKSKLIFRKPIATDVQSEDIVFTARGVMYIIASYVDGFGIEHLPPFKLITFQYAASDIRKDGKEDTIKNFCQYATKLKPEIEYLRKHPLYGLTFSENTNEMMNEDTKKSEFKVRAANLVSTMPPESVYERARLYKISNYASKSAEELRPSVIARMVAEFEADAKALEDDILRRRALGMLSSKKED